MSKKYIIIMIAAAVLPIILFFVFVREKDDWSRLDSKAYSTMDDLSLLQRMIEIDDSTRKEVAAAGGEEAMIAMCRHALVFMP